MDKGAPLWKRLWVRILALRGIHWDTHVKAFLHFAVASVVLAALNWIFSRSDPGWLKLNPSPWALLPFYLGFRFGTGWGLGSGIALLVIRSAMAGWGGGAHFAMTGPEYFLLWGALLMGAAGGFARGVAGRRESLMEKGLESSQASNRKLRSQVALLKHNEQDLAAALVARRLDKTGLILTLQSIIQHQAPEDRDEAFLNMLRDRCGVLSAAIYFSARGGRAVRAALLRSDQFFPKSLDKTPMIEHAERTQKIVTQRWFWEPFEPNATGGADDRYLCVAAHPRGKDFRVLIVSRMRFEEIHWENLWKLESAFRWYENVLNGVQPIDFVEPEEEEGPSLLKTEEAAPETPLPKPKSPPQPAVHHAVKPEPAAEKSPAVPGRRKEELKTETVPAMAEVKPSPRPAKSILDASGFKQRLAQCRKISQDAGLEHRLVVFVPGDSESRERSEGFAQSLSEIMPWADDLARIPSDGGRFVYGLITPAPTTEHAENHANELLGKLPDLDLRYFVLRLNDAALSAFEN